MIREHSAKSERFRYAATLAVTCLLMATAQAADDLTQPIRVSPDGHFLAQPDGQPFFWLGDTALELFPHLDHDEADKYLQDRARKGFTVIQAVAMGYHDALTKQNRYGELALIDNDPTRPNPRYFENVDWVVDRAAHYGLRVAMLPTWGLLYVVGGTSKIFTPANAEIYGRWIAARYRHKGVIWVLGGDTTPLWAKDWTKRDFTIEDYRPVFDAMAKGIMEGDGEHPFITYHPACCSFSATAQPRTSPYFHDRAWLDMNMLQSSHFLNPEAFLRQTGLGFGWNATFNYEPIADEYNSKPTRPVVDGEMRWEDIPIDLVKAQKWKAYDIRNGAYHALLAGAAGYNYGNINVALIYDPARKPPEEMEWRPWQEALDAPGAGQMQYVKTLMLSRPYFTRIPDQSLIIGDAKKGESHIGASRDRDGSYAMVYVPKGQPVTVDLNKITGLRAVAWWFDPRTGAATKIDGSFPTSGAVTFTPPSRGPESDWVLVVDGESKGFVPPGTKQ